MLARGKYSPTMVRNETTPASVGAPTGANRDAEAARSCEPESTASGIAVPLGGTCDEPDPEPELS